MTVKINLSKIEEIKDLRKVWKDEARDFTPWLAEDDNIELLSDAVGIEITECETESKSGSFNVDIFAKESNTGRKIIIENQLEPTNHDHLGKLITYASGKSADVVIWVVKNARDDHKRAIEWLNEHTDQDIGFFLCEIKLYKIGDSDIAPKFVVVEKPNDWAKEQKQSDTVTPTMQQRYNNWCSFIEYASKDTEFIKEFSIRQPSTDHWFVFSIQSPRCHTAILQLKKENRVAIELYISRDKDLYHDFYKNKKDIEKIVGFELDWRELPERKASRILAFRDNVDLSNPRDWEDSFDWIMDTLLKFKKAFKKYI